MPTKRVDIEVDGHTISMSNPDKVMYPDAGFTKSDVAAYYRAISGVIIPHLRDRAVTRIRYPSGTGQKPFYEKNAPKGTPDWVRLATVATPGSSKDRDSADFVVADNEATLVWLSNLAALELHTHQWLLDGREADETEPRHPDRLVADLDPGPGSTRADSATVAFLLRDRLAEDGLTAYVKSSGKKGLHLCCPIAATQPDEQVSAYAEAVARELEEEHPELITANMLKVKREGRVFIDWSQNNAAKTTVAPWSLRGLTVPTVSVPMTWDEVDGDRDLRFTPEEALERAAEGDLWAPLLERGPEVPEQEKVRKRRPGRRWT